MVAPPYFPVPPDGYGGVEAVVADLVDALVVAVTASRHRCRPAPEPSAAVHSHDDNAPTAGLGEPRPESSTPPERPASSMAWPST